MIIIKSKQELDLMREAGKVCGQILRDLKDLIKPGISTLEIDRFVEKTVREHGMTAAGKRILRLSCQRMCFHKR